MSTFLRIALPMALALAFSGESQSSELCAQLNSQLNAVSETYSAPAEVRKYARAIAEQKLSIRELRHTLRETGCSSGSMLVIGGENAGECSALEGKMARMEANLAVLNEKRSSLLAGQQSGRDRRRLLAAIEDHGCNALPVMASTNPIEPDDTASLVTAMPDGRETIQIPTDDDYDNSQFIDLGGSATTGSYRTMCVRTCDGAFFPISSQASTLNFQRDAQVCSMMCPGVATELYYHPIRQESDAMRSAITGRRYDELDQAYRFRISSKKDKACTCNFSLYYKEMMRREAYIADPAKAGAKQSSIVWVKPELRGQLRSEVASSKPVKDAIVRDYEPNEQIRQIGPKFLPDDAALELERP
jgi:hypothetical protein